MKNINIERRWKHQMIKYIKSDMHSLFKECFVVINMQIWTLFAAKKKSFLSFYKYQGSSTINDSFQKKTTEKRKFLGVKFKKHQNIN